MKNLKQKVAAFLLMFAVVCTMIPAIPAEAAVKKLSKADFKCQVKVEKGSYDYDKGKFAASGSKWVSHNYASEIDTCGYSFVIPKVKNEIPNTQSYVSQTGYTSEGWETNFKTSRGIVKNSTKDQVVKAYGKGTVIKIKDDKFMTYYKNYDAVIYENVCAMQNYQYALEYNFAKSSSEKWTMRFYFDKNNKCKAVLFAKKLSSYIKKSGDSSGFKLSFAAPSGKSIKTKTIAGHSVKVLPKNTTVKMSGNSNVYRFELLYYDKNGKLLGRYGEDIAYNGKVSNDFLYYASPTNVTFWGAPASVQNKITQNYAYTKVIVQKYAVSGKVKYPYKACTYYIDARKCTR